MAFDFGVTLVRGSFGLTHQGGKSRGRRGVRPGRRSTCQVAPRSSPRPHHKHNDAQHGNGARQRVSRCTHTCPYGISSQCQPISYSPATREVRVHDPTTHGTHARHAHAPSGLWHTERCLSVRAWRLRGAARVQHTVTPLHQQPRVRRVPKPHLRRPTLFPLTRRTGRSATRPTL
jgi:hypothetical protein